MKQQIQSLEEKHTKKDIPQFDIGDTVEVHFTIREENKTRIQIFSGIVIARKGQGIRKTFTVRRISYGEGVERAFPLHSPLINKITVKKRGKVKRAKLYYMRAKKGKEATKVKGRIAQKKQSEE